MDDESKDALRKCLEARNWDQYFITVVDDWEDLASKDITEDAPLGPVKTSSDPRHLVSRKEESHIRRHCPKRQSRIVFKEVCVALHDVPQLGDIVKALLDCVFALQLMFLAGWVHRDISSGNLYRSSDSNGGVRGRLGDLEYAKRFRPSDGKGSSDPKTGTAQFMAVEIQEQCHLYLPQLDLDDYDDYDDDDISQLVARHASRPHSPPMVHNFEHDMESIFWVLLWTILMRFPDPNNERSHRAYDLYDIFHDSSIYTTERGRVFKDQGPLRRHLTRFLAPQLKPLLNLLDALRRVLLGGYLRRGYSVDDLSSYSGLYQFLREALRYCQRLTETTSLPDLLDCHSVYLVR